MNSKLNAITEKAAEDFRALVNEAEAKILEAWDAAEQEAQDNETPAKFKLGLIVTLDLEKDAMETALSFGVRHKLTANCQIPDPSQASLDLDEKPRVHSSEEAEPDTVRMVSGNVDTGEIPMKKFSEAVKKLTKAAK